MRRREKERAGRRAGGQYSIKRGKALEGKERKGGGGLGDFSPLII